MSVSVGFTTQIYIGLHNQCIQYWSRSFSSLPQISSCKKGISIEISVSALLNDIHTHMSQILAARFGWTIQSEMHCVYVYIF